MLFKCLVAVFPLLVASLPAVGQGIDLSNVVAGDVIDNSTPIPNGALINLNGGSIAAGTTFSAADFPNGFELNINEGFVGLDVEINNATINIAGGQVALGASNLAEGVNNFSNTIAVTGGEVGGFFQLRGNSTLEISGGSVESFGTLTSASATVTGGAFIFMDNNGVLNLSGGDVGAFRALPNSVVNLSGTDFAIDGVPVTGLVLNTPFEVPNRNVTISGTLSDGSTFSNFLDSITPISQLNFGPFPTLADLEAVPGFASLSSTINVILVPGVGDFDADGDVDGDDVDFYNGNLGQPASFNNDLDLNNDVTITLADHDQHITTLVETSNGQTGALIGDVNLDGAVDVLNDGFILVSNLGAAGPFGYADGDLTADGIVNVLGDAFRLVANLGLSNAQ